MAHPDLLEQIATVTQQLDKQGHSAALHLQRAELFRRHAQFEEALADLAAAERLQTNSARLTLERGRVLCDAGRAAESLVEIQKFLETAPSHAEGLIIRARGQARLGRAEAAVADYNAAIAGSPAPGPDLFLERAKQQAALGRLEEAARGLDEAGADALSPPLLQLTAIEYDRRRGAFDSALARADKLLARYPVKEPWLTLRAEVLEQAGRKAEAGRAFGQVLAGLEKYSPLRRSLDLTKQLEARARAGLIRTQPGATASASQ